MTSIKSAKTRFGELSNKAIMYYISTINPVIQKMDEFHIYMMLLSCVFILHSVGCLNTIVSCFICFLLPMHKTLITIKEKTSNSSLMLYWFIYSSITTCELLLSSVIAYIPLYQIIKIGFMMALYNLKNVNPIVCRFLEKVSCLIKWNKLNTLEEMVAEISSVLTDDEKKGDEKKEDKKEDIKFDGFQETTEMDKEDKNTLQPGETDISSSVLP